MPTKKTTTTKRTSKARAAITPRRDPDSIEAFAFHLSEVLRIGRTAEIVTSRLYNDLAGAWNDDGINAMPELGQFQESPDYIALALTTAARQRAERKEVTK